MGNQDKKLTLTIESPLLCDDSETLELLDKVSRYYNYLNRKLLNKVINNEMTRDYKNSLKRDFIATYKIPGRLYNSLKFNCDGMIQSQDKLKKTTTQKTKTIVHRIKNRIEKTLKILSKGYRQTKKDPVLPHEKKIYKRNIFLWKQKIDRIKNKNYSQNIVCGSKSFYRKQWNYESHEKWLQEWRRRRYGNILLVGSKDENHGNSLCQYKNNKLSLRLPYFFESKEVKRIELPVKFYSDKENKNSNYYNYFQEAIEKKIAISYRFIKRDNNKWYVLASFSLTRDINKSVTGYIGVDTNYELLATTETDYKGNYIGFKNYTYTSHGETNQHKDELSLIVKDIVNRAVTLKKGIVIETLNLTLCKIGNNKKSNRKISSISYTMFFNLLKTRCLKNNVMLKSVNPSYTSVIGKYKYKKFYGISTHNAAGLVIARRALFSNKEKMPYHLTCILHSAEEQKWSPIFRYRHHWSHWAFFHKSFTKCSKKLDSYTSSASIMNNQTVKGNVCRLRYLL